MTSNPLRNAVSGANAPGGRASTSDATGAASPSPLLRLIDPRDEGAVYDRLREGSPKSGAKHIDLACKIAVVAMAVVSTALVVTI